MSSVASESRLPDGAVSTLAARLLAAFESGVPVDPPTSEYPALAVEDAYRVQRALLTGHELAGRRVTGRKIGLTSLAMQRQLGIDSPDFGALLDTHTFESGEVLSRSHARVISPKVEPEVAVVLARPLAGPGITAADVQACTSEVIAVIEVIDSRVRDWRIGLADTIADNASCFAAVAGDRRSSSELGELSALEVTLTRNGAVEQNGNGTAVMGDPYEAVAWLANELGRHGDTLEAGQLVLAGSFTAAIDATPGTYVADFGPALGSVALEVVD